MTSAAHDVSSESPQRATAWVSVRRWEAINDWAPGPLGGAGSYGLFLRGEEAARVVSIAWPGARPVQEGARGVQRRGASVRRRDPSPQGCSHTRPIQPTSRLRVMLRAAAL